MDRGILKSVKEECDRRKYSLIGQTC
uniref:Uncharacterized protein n=1 Tax=Anguilla anguilla TaxID=7936 RepID=A0A0E9VXH4_ANGAN